MKANILTLPLLLFVLYYTNVNAQTVYRTYKTQAVHQRLLQENPDYKMNLRQMERQITNFRMVGLQKEITIPVIFHVVYNQPNEKVSAEQIYSQLAALNRDFGHESIKVNTLLAIDTLANFHKVRPEQTGIKFCLADLNGEVGINYISSSETSFSDDDAIKLLRDAEVIAPQNYLNVWVGHLADNVSGYSQFPNANAATDGIVIDYRFFGTMGTADATYNNGNTLTHLVGSYLGLYELWNETEPCGDDGVWDTPIHNAPNYGRIEHFRHISLCEGNPVEMTANFMDNTLGGYMFTKGQMRRMNAVLAIDGLRSGLNKGTVLCNNANMLEEIAQERSARNIVKENQPLSFTIQPNPVKEQLNLNIKETTGNIIIYSLNGKLLYQAEDVQQLQLDVSQWTANLYYVQVYNDEERITKSFVIAQ